MSAIGERLRAPAAAILADHILAAASSCIPPGLVNVVQAHAAVSGVICTGPQAASTCRHLSLAGFTALRAVDFAAYERFQASASTPVLGPGHGQRGMVPWSLSDLVGNVANWGADVVFVPSGRVRAGDSSALAAVIDAGNEAEAPEAVTTLAVYQDWLTRTYRQRLQHQMKRSIRPVGLVVIGQLDPFEDQEIAEGLLEVLDACQGQVFQHRTDMTALEVLGRAGLGASIGVTASLRHTVPPGRRPQTRRRKQPPQQPRLHIFVPGISEFRELGELESWFGDNAPQCTLPGCCGRRITSFTRDSADVDVLAVHNVRGWLGVASELAAHPAHDRRDWLRAHRLQVDTAYDELRARTGVRAIKPYGSARVWRALDS